jgi:hypothetical protein
VPLRRIALARAADGQPRDTAVAETRVPRGSLGGVADAGVRAKTPPAPGAGGRIEPQMGM